MATRLVVSPRFLSLRLLLLFIAIMVTMIPAIQQQQQQQHQSDLNNQSGNKNTEETLFRPKRQISKRQFTVGAVFETTARGSSEYQAFMNFPSSASLLWQNFRIKQRIVHVEDLKNSFQVASAICELVAEGIVAIFVPVYPETLTIVKSMTLQHDVLVFTMADAHHFGTSQQELNDSVNVIKLRPLKAPAIIDFILDAGWEDVLYLYESQQANYRLRWILERMIRHHPGFTVDFRRLRSAAESVDDGTGGRDGRYGLLQYVNPRTKYFQRKSIILDVTSSAMTKLALHDIETLMPERADFQFLIVGGDTKIVNNSVLRYGGINMTVLSLINFNSAAMKNYLSELHPRAREPIYLPTNLTYEAALLIDGLHALVEVLKLLNDPLSTEADKLGNENARTTAYKSTLSAPCMPNFVPPFTATSLVTKIRQTSFIGLTGNISFSENGFREGYAFEVWGTKMKQSFDKIGIWNSQKGILKEPAKTHRNMSSEVDHNRLRIVTSILLPPFMMEVRDEDGNVIEGKYEGFCVDLVDKLAELIKFKYKLKVVSDGQFGAYINGSWNGMIGELIHKKADIVVAPLTITSSRERVVDFSTPFMELGLSVMYQKIERPTPDVLSFMEPLSTEIWMCISFAYLGVSVVLFLVSRLSPSEWGLSLRKLKLQAPIGANLASGSVVSGTTNQTTLERHLGGNNSVSSIRSSGGTCGAALLEQDAVLMHPTVEGAPGEMHNPFSIFNSFWFALSTFVQQGGDIVPRSLPGRIVGGAWWFFTLIIISSYTANLAAYLTVERMTSPIESYEDLARQTKVKYGVIKLGSSKEFFEKSNMKIFQKMWKFMESNPDVLVDSVSDGVNRVRQSNRDYAFLLESTMNEYFNQRQPCNTVKVGPNLESGKGYGVATPPGSDLRDQINLAVLQLKEMDWIASLYRFWWEERGECGKMSKSTDGSLTTNSLGLDNVYGLFYLLAGALVTGVVLSVFEFIYRCAVDAKRAKRGFGEVLCEMIHNATTDRPRLTIPIRFQPTQSPAKPTSQSEMLLKGRSDEQVGKVDYCL